MKYCPNCGKPVEPDSQFCGNCGYRLTSAEGVSEPSGSAQQLPAEVNGSQTGAQDQGQASATPASTGTPQQAAPATPAQASTTGTSSSQTAATPSAAQPSPAQPASAQSPAQAPTQPQGASQMLNQAASNASNTAQTATKNTKPIIIGAVCLVIVLILAAIIIPLSHRGKSQPSASAHSSAPSHSSTHTPKSQSPSPSKSSSDKHKVHLEKYTWKAFGNLLVSAEPNKLSFWFPGMTESNESSCQSQDIKLNVGGDSTSRTNQLALGGSGNSDKPWIVSIIQDSSQAKGEAEKKTLAAQIIDPISCKVINKAAPLDLSGVEKAENPKVSFLGADKSVFAFEVEAKDADFINHTYAFGFDASTGSVTWHFDQSQGTPIAFSPEGQYFLATTGDSDSATSRMVSIADGKDVTTSPSNCKAFTTAGDNLTSAYEYSEGCADFGNMAVDLNAGTIIDKPAIKAEFSGSLNGETIYIGHDMDRKIGLQYMDSTGKVLGTIFTEKQLREDNINEILGYANGVIYTGYSKYEADTYKLYNLEGKEVTKTTEHWLPVHTILHSQKWTMWDAPNTLTYLVSDTFGKETSSQQ